MKKFDKQKIVEEIRERDKNGDWAFIDKISLPLCVTCKHLHVSRIKRQQGKCDAFPNGIPREITDGTVSHTDYVKGDNGIKYEPL